MRIIDNQPVSFSESNNCLESIDYAQIVDVTDKTQFQLGLEVCNSTPNSITDPQFQDDTQWILGANWSFNGFGRSTLLCHTEGSYDGASTSYSLDPNKYYEVIIVVESIDFGSKFQVALGSEIVGYITSVGTFTFYGFPSVYLGNYYLSIAPIVDGAMCITEIDAYEILLNTTVAIKDLNGTTIKNIDYLNFTEYFVISDNTVTVNINWSELNIDKSGCYQICIADPCENTNGQNYPAIIQNCEFSGSATNWTLGASWSYGTNNVSVLATGGRADRTITQTNVFGNYLNSYCVDIEITAGAGYVDVYFGTNLVGTISGVGVHNVCGTPTDNLDISLQSTGVLTITSICPTTITDITCNYTSNIFKLGDYSNDCTILINACNNENGLGFNFSGSGFSPRIRVSAKLRQSKYTSEKTIYEDSLGKKGVVYFSGRKSKTLCADLLPEYVHDFLRLLVGFDNVYLDGELYVVEDDEYNVQWVNELDNIGNVRLEVSKKVQNAKNTNCSDNENVCTLAESFLIQDSGDFILQDDGYKIIING